MSPSPPPLPGGGSLGPILTAINSSSEGRDKAFRVLYLVARLVREELDKIKLTTKDYILWHRRAKAVSGIEKAVSGAFRFVGGIVILTGGRKFDSSPVVSEMFCSFKLLGFRQWGGVCDGHCRWQCLSRTVDCVFQMGCLHVVGADVNTCCSQVLFFSTSFPEILIPVP